MRRPVIAANWKMNKTVGEGMDFLKVFLPAVRDIKDTEIVIAPPFPLLFPLAEKLKGTNVRLSAQNVFYEEKGAFTGEVSPAMLTDAGCSWVIVGHSERRQYFRETDEIVNRKIRAAQAQGLQVICCIGESLHERETGATFGVLERQLHEGLRDVNARQLAIAYEPIWAIGTGRTATPEQAQEAHAHIRNVLRSVMQDDAVGLRLLYGGSATPENVDSLMARDDIDGVLVGGASLKPESFERIVKFQRGTA